MTLSAPSVTTMQRMTQNARRAPAGLRVVFAATTSLVVALSLTAAAAVIVLTTLLNRTSESIGAAVENVRLAEEAEIALLLHERARDPVVRNSVEERLRGYLREAESFVTSPREAEVLGRARARTEEYLAAAAAADDGEAPAQQIAAYRALDELVDVNVAQAHAARAEGDRIDRLANVVGATAALATIVVAVALLVWLFRRAFRPVLALADTMARFGRGERDVRALEQGPSELVEMSRRFNEMATAVSRQRDMQMAFLGSIAHDLKNPLSALRMTLSFIDLDGPLPEEPKLRSSLQRIARQITRMERMIGDLLELSAIDSGKLAFRSERHDARRIAKDVVDLFAGAAAQGHPLELRMPTAPVDVVCDDLRVEQVLTNLVSNAIKYSPSGTAVEVTAERIGDRAVLRVRDHGRGIAPDETERIFEPFQRLASTGALDAPPGVGLGLFAARRIVESQGGRIAVESALGAGSTFSVELPAASAAEAEHDRTMTTRPVVRT